MYHTFTEIHIAVNIRQPSTSRKVKDLVDDKGSKGERRSALRSG